jgi:hypothetical protein
MEVEGPLAPVFLALSQNDRQCCLTCAGHVAREWPDNAEDQQHHAHPSDCAGIHVCPVEYAGKDHRSAVSSDDEATNKSSCSWKKENLIACRGLGRVVGPLLAARALPLRCAASTLLSSALLAI